MRLDKYLSNAKIITRSNVTKFLKDNEVLVNGIRISKKDYKIDENNDIIKVNGEVIEYNEFVYFLLNKPSGVVSAVKDNLDKTVVDMIDTEYYIFPVGRLDKDTEGLIILTNDGALAHALTMPQNHVIKKYYALVDKLLDDHEIQEFKNGIKIKDGDGDYYTTKKADIERSGDGYIVSISEGKYHQVKRMFEHFGSKVTYLKRIAFKNIVLDDKLRIGKYRKLEKEEINDLKNNIVK